MSRALRIAGALYDLAFIAIITTSFYLAVGILQMHTLPTREFESQPQTMTVQGMATDMAKQAINTIEDN